MSVVLSATERERLVKLLGMLGSAYDGERAAAALKASNLIRDQGLIWEEVVGGMVPAPPQLQASSRHPSTSGWPASRLGEMQLVLANLPVLTEWEQGFIRSVADRQHWSQKQAARFAEVVGKVRARSAGGRS